MAGSNIKATVSPIVPAGSGSPLQLSSTALLRSADAVSRLGSGLAGQIAGDLDSIRVQVNALNTQAQKSPQITQLLLTDPVSGLVTAAFGPVTFEGVVYNNYLSEIHVGNPLGTRDPQEALFNANLDGSVSIGQNGWLDVHDPFDGNAAWIGTRNDTLAVTGAANNGAGLIRLTVPGHNFATGNTAQVRNLQLYGVPNAIGTWVLTVINGSHVDLQGSVWAGLYAAPSPLPAGVDTYSPTIDRVLQVTGAVSAGGLIKLQTAVAHTYLTGDKVNVPGVPGVAAATGQWIIKVIDATHFTLNSSVFSGTFTGNGTCLRYFAGVLAQTLAIGNSFTDFNLRAFADGTLEIKNASIIVISPNGEIIIDPSGPLISLYDAANNLIAWLGVNGIYTGFWGKNVWIGGTGPADAVISATGGGVAINGAPITLLGNGVLTTINNAVGGTTFAQSIVSEDVPSGDYSALDPYDLVMNYGGVTSLTITNFITPTVSMVCPTNVALQSIMQVGLTGALSVLTGPFGTVTLQADASTSVEVSNGVSTAFITPTQVNSPGFAVGGDVGINLTLNPVTAVGVTLANFVTSLNIGSGNVGTSLTVNTSATGVFGTPGAGQSNGTVVTGVTMNFNTVVSSISLNVASAVTAVTPTTTSHTWTEGILTL